MEISKFITHFKKKIDEYDRLQLADAGGLKPHLPQVVIFWGEDACKGYEAISKRLFQLWPQYKKEILFFFVENATEESDYYQLTTEETGVVSNKKSLEEWQGLVNGLFGEDHYFGSLNNLLVYHVLDTTGFPAVDQFDQWTAAMKYLIAQLDMGSASILDIFFVLLNENIPARQIIAKEIKNKLAQTVHDQVSTTVLLSNRRSDGAVTRNWDKQYQIVTNVMTLTNHRDLALLEGMSKHGIYTVSYAREDKPVNEIGQVIVQKLLDKLSAINFTNCGDLKSDTTLPGRLGLSESGSITVLDQYVEETVGKKLPTPAQLSLFPRDSAMELDHPEQCSARDFNQITMGAWACYVENIVMNVEVHVNHAQALRSDWQTRYAQFLAEHLKVSELIWLADHPDFVQEKLGATKVARDTDQVLTAAMLQLKYLFSAKFNDIFTQEVLEAGRRAKAFLRDWNALLQSGRNLFEVNDESLRNYYGGIATHYVDTHYGDISQELKTIQSQKAMECYLENLINNIIDINHVVLTPFEDELNTRLGNGLDGGGAQVAISRKLSNDQVPVYTKTTFTLQAPMYSLVMLKTGTGLYDTLRTNLAPNTKYYNTGLGNAAEAINIYKLNDGHLIGG